MRVLDKPQQPRKIGTHTAVIPDVVRDQPATDGRQRFGWVDQHGVIHQTYTACMSLASTAPTSTCQMLWGGFQLHVNGASRSPTTGGVPKNEDGRLFVQWMVDPDLSPWRDVRPSNADNGLDELCDVGFIHTDLSVPHLLLTNFYIQSRWASEYSVACSRWAEMVRGGVHPSLAFCIASMHPARLTHNALPTYEMTEEDVLRFVACAPVDVGEPANETKLDIYCNQIWTSGERASYTYSDKPGAYATYLSGIASKFKKGTKAGSFSSVSEIDYTALGLSEMERLGITYDRRYG